MRNDDRRERDKRGFAPRQGGKNPPRPARRTFDIPPAERVDGPFETLPARAHDHAHAEAMPVRPEERAQTRTLPVRPYGERSPRMERPPRAHHEERDVQPPENLLVGRNPIREALKSGAPLEKLLVAEGDLSGAARDIVRMAREAGVVVQFVERYRLDQIYPAHQGLLAFRSARAYATIEDILARARERGEEPLVVVLDQVTDPHNLGAIIRSAEVAGAHGVVIPRRRSAGLNGACAKASAGALEHLPVARVSNLPAAMAELKENGLFLFAADMAGVSLYETDLTVPAGIVIGSEGAGLSRLVREGCDAVVSIPQHGHIPSLNASNAAAVLLFETVRQRGVR